MVGLTTSSQGLSAGAATLRHWREALAYREVAAVTSSYGGVTGGIFLMRDRFQVSGGPRCGRNGGGGYCWGGHSVF